ncbi:Transmembrane protein 63C [Saguinus oedipus]|uniref:Transmembrane protein 63C n=1 Tax=Saguinus oedipus TaxID=9490 RepID=A0ABQ9V563_SAGOE|nr:Transmembrane protein 63C [Saguinus oedipus]
MLDRGWGQHIPNLTGRLSTHVCGYSEAYPGSVVTRVHFCYDVRNLIDLDDQRRHAMRGRLFYTAKAKKTGKVMIRIHPCARLCFCRCWTCFKEASQGPGLLEVLQGHHNPGRLEQGETSGPGRPSQGSGPSPEGRLPPQVDAEQYYSELEEQLTDEFNAELNRVPLKRLDLIFVTFQDSRMAKR